MIEQKNKMIKLCCTSISLLKENEMTLNDRPVLPNQHQYWP